MDVYDVISAEEEINRLKKKFQSLEADFYRQKKEIIKLNDNLR